MSLKKLLDEIKSLKNTLNYPCRTKLQGIKETVEAVDNTTIVKIALTREDFKLWQQIKEELK